VSVRAGKSERLPDDLPREVAPLARDLNSMIAVNNEMISRARAEAGNLAHGLKTPLAILMDEANQLESAQAKSAGVIKQQCHLMQRHIDYQMARARAVGRGAPGAGTSVPAGIREIISALSRLHRDRGITLAYIGPEDLLVACDPQDFGEMIGNLADNAAKWARSRVTITAARDGDNISITVEDDGPGIPAESRETVFALGEKLDERMPGAGLGLAITREIATLYRGRTWLGRSGLGGAAAHLMLPAPTSGP
jgi:signal transduction histidine kinase